MISKVSELCEQYEASMGLIRGLSRSTRHGSTAASARERRLHAKRHLKSQGWSYRSASPELGVSFVHLSLVLNGHRESRRLLLAIQGLPRRPSKPALPIALRQHASG